MPEGMGDCWCFARPAGELAAVLEALHVPETPVFVRSVVRASEALGRWAGCRNDVEGIFFNTAPAAAAYLRRLERTVQVVADAMAGSGGLLPRREPSEPVHLEEPVELSEGQVELRMVEEAMRWEAVMAEEVDDTFGNFVPPGPVSPPSLVTIETDLGETDVEEAASPPLSPVLLGRESPRASSPKRRSVPGGSSSVSGPPLVAAARPPTRWTPAPAVPLLPAVTRPPSMWPYQQIVIRPTVVVHSGWIVPVSGQGGGFPGRRF